MNKIYSDITELIGRTPIVRLSRLEVALGLNAELYAKLEYLNPTGSAKDRAALSMINTALRDGIISEGATVIEPTSGNTGIALASVCAARGMKAVIVMPANMPKERVRLMEAYGANVVLSPADEGMAGAIRVANELHEKTENSFIPNQFENEANIAAHLETTAPEIYRAMGEDVDILVAGVGTGGTVIGIAEGLADNCPNISIVAVEPQSSPVITEGRAGSHGIFGIGANFIPPLFDSTLVDKVLTVSEDEAHSLVKECGRREGIALGVSSGAALAAAVREGMLPENEGKRILVICPDGIDRYLSVEDLF